VNPRRPRSLAGPGSGPDVRTVNPEIATLPGAAMRALQLERLPARLEYVADRSLFYADLWKAEGLDPEGMTSLEDFDARPPSAADLPDWTIDS
jgi:phenylacetate-coenzyme A ligase PaaK-like adenylate-forming protein